MANTGHILSVPGYPLARIENNISVNIRDGFLKIVGGQPGTLPRALPPAGTRTAVSPTWYPVSRVGRKVRSGLDFWYENLILDPTEKNCHTIIATLEYAIIIWNSSRFDTLTFAIERIGWEGIEDTIPSTLTLAPLEHKVYTIAVTMGGASIIDGRLRFSNALAGTAEHHVFGKRGVVWGFRPNAGLKERWEWKTEINKTWDYTEERLALRVVPRLSFDASYAAEQGTDATQIELMLYDMYTVPYFLPRFEQQVSAVVSAGQSVVALDTTASLWREGMTGVFWASPRMSELFTVARVSAGELEITSPVTQNLGACLVMPCYAASLTGGTTRTDSATAHTLVSASWLVDYPPDWEIQQPELLLDGVEVWDFPLYVQSGGLQRTIETVCVLLDNGLAPPQRLHIQPAALGNQQVTLLGDGIAEIMALRSRLLRRQGCACPFWASTKRHDLILLEKVRGGSEYLVVAGAGNGMSAPLARSPRRWLLIVLTDGRQCIRALRSIKRLDAERDEMRLTEALFENEDIMPAQIERISFLSQYRLAADTIEWTWQRTNRADVSFAVQEIL